MNYHTNCHVSDHRYHNTLPDVFCEKESKDGKALAWVMGDGGHFFNGFYDENNKKI